MIIPVDNINLLKLRSRVLIVDDHEVVLYGIKSILSSHFNVRNIYLEKNGQDALTCINENKEIELLIIEIALPLTNIFEIIRNIKLLRPHIKIIIHSIISANLFEKRLIKLGVNGYVEKGQPVSELIHTIKNVIHGNGYDNVYDKLNSKEWKYLDHLNPLAVLSERELLVVRCLVKGDTNLDIAKKFNLKQSTIGTFKMRAMDKLQVSSVVDLVELLNRYECH